MKTRLRIKCRVCGCWNSLTVSKLFVEQDISEPKVKVLIPLYRPHRTGKCGKCGTVLAEPDELIRIIKKPIVSQFSANTAHRRWTADKTKTRQLG